MNFCHLSVHSKASVLYGMANIDGLIQKAVELGYKNLAITDYSNIFNIVDFYKTAKQHNIKPIIGVDICFCEDVIQYKAQKIRKFSRMILLAENNTGLHNIARLISLSNNEMYFYYVPRVDFSLLEKYKDGIICLSGNSLDGVISNYLYDKKDSDGEISEPAALFKAEGLVRRLVQIFGKNHFFLEVQNTGISEQSIINDRLRSIASKYDLKTVATNNVHYIHKHEAEAHKTLLAMNSNQFNRSTSVTFDTEEYYLKSIQELQFLEDEISITNTIAERCNVDIDLKKRRLPKYQFLPNNKTSSEYLRDLAHNGLITKNFRNTSEYIDRLNRELNDIEEMGFADYFLIVYDIISWIRNQNILLGWGRGSIGGSLVAYCLGITDIDPLKYGLIWERFLNKGRGGLPDIDTDVPRSRRQEVLNYIKERFGSNNVAQIITLGGLQARAVLKEVFRVYDMPFDEANKITSLIPAKNEEHESISLQEAIDAVPELKTYYDKYTPWFKIALSLEGCYKSIGLHAAGVVISDIPLNDSMYPLVRSKDGGLAFGWDMKTVDTLSILKLDILGLTTLDDIQLIFDLVEKRRRVKLARQYIVLDDPITFSLFENGYTVGVFQLEKQLGKNWSKNIKPQSINEISDLVSLIRPATLDTGLTQQYVDTKNGVMPFTPAHPLLADICKDTYAVLCYQEQTIFACQKLAGFSLQEADSIRRVIGKKKPAELKEWKPKFINGCLNNNITEENANQIWDQLEKFAGYQFNRCLSGKTIVTKAGSSISKRDISIRELWEYYHGDKQKTPNGKKYRNKTHPRLGLRIFCYKDGRAKPGRILDIIKNDVKITYLLTLTNGKNIRATLDHKVLTLDGWKKIGDLDINNDKIIISDLTYEDTSLEYFAKIGRLSKGNRIFKKNVQYYSRGNQNTGYIDGGSIAYKTIRRAKINSINSCEVCCKSNIRLELAHLDGDHTNQEKNNLKLMCVSCHKQHDYKFNNRNAKFDKGYPTDVCSILSIDHPIQEMTYDIEMADDEHNFFANGICTHNSHGIGYGLLAYETAFLKANYPIEFFCAKLQHAESHPERFEQIALLVYDAKLFNIEVLPPRLKYGNADFNIVDDHKISFGLSSIKGIGRTTIINLIKIANQHIVFDDIIWYVLTNKTKISSAVILALIRSGVFDSEIEHRVECERRFKLLESLTDKEREAIKIIDSKNWINAIRILSDENNALELRTKFSIKIPNINRREKLREFLTIYNSSELFDSKAQRIAWEQHYLGIALSGSEADIYRSKDTCMDLIKNGQPSTMFEIAVCIDNVRKITTKKGDPMAFVTARDKTYIVDNIVVFPRIFQASERLLESGNVIRIKGKIDDRRSLVANYIERLK